MSSPVRSIFRRLLRFAALLVVGVVALFVLSVFFYYKNVDYEPVFHSGSSSDDSTPPVEWAPKHPERIRILVMSGGGLHGLGYLEVLKYFEEKSGKPIAELFDFVAATSVGSIVASSLLVPDETGKPQHTAENLIASFEELTNEILSAPLYHQILTLDGIFGPKFLNHGKALAAHRTYADRQFGELILPVMVPVYSPTEPSLEKFSNLEDDHADISLSALVAAATSVPSLFPAIRLHGPQSDKPYIDATFVLNTPLIPAFLFALEKNPDAEFVIVSLGTDSKHPISRLDSFHNGLAEWVLPLLAMVFTGQEQIAMEAMATFDRMNRNDIEVFSLKPTVPWNWGPFDKSEHNLSRIKKAGADYVSEHSQMLDEVLLLLTSDPRTE